MKYVKYITLILSAGLLLLLLIIVAILLVNNLIWFCSFRSKRT